jgi:hydrogenase expression/formation protein HypC
MCLAIPLRVIAIEGNMARVESGGTQTRCRIDVLAEVAVGDYVLVHAGLAIGRVDEEEAQETLRLLRELEQPAEEGPRSP